MKMPKFIVLFLVFSFIHRPLYLNAQAALHILGVTQDAGLPQLGCIKKCCVENGQPRKRVPVISLGITQADPAKCILIEATPDMESQWRTLTMLNNGREPSAILLTHAHIGHYTGLMQLGREARNAQSADVFGSERMIAFLQNNQPWKQLTELHNIKTNVLLPDKEFNIGSISVHAMQVPHRDEISDTYAYLLKGPSKTALFLPDIDKWGKWGVSLDSLIDKVDYALIDATFYDEKELPGRDLSEIPHPTVVETMQLAENWPVHKRNKILLIHLNHTNPLLMQGSTQFDQVVAFGFRIAKTGERLPL